MRITSGVRLLNQGLAGVLCVSALLFIRETRRDAHALDLDEPGPCDPAFALRPAINPMISMPPALRHLRAGRRIIEREASQVVVDEIPQRDPRLWMLVTATGHTANALLHRSSGSVQADSIAIRAARKLRWEPAAYQRIPVCYWLNLPLPVLDYLGA